MDSSAFNLFYYQLKQVSLTEKKLFLLKREKFLCFTPEQLISIVSCFPHSNDKTAVVKLLEKKLGGKFKWLVVSRLIKSAVYSRDRIEILKLLINHVEPMTEFERQRFVALTFDLKPDRIKAYNIANQCNGINDDEQDTDFDAIYDYQEPNMCDVREVIENYAKTTNRRNSVFEMPFLSELNFVRNYIDVPETKENIQTEIDNRKKSNLDFYIPSKVSSISMNLKPYRQTAATDRRNFSIRNSNRRICKSLSNLQSPEEVQRHDFERIGDENRLSSMSIDREKIDNSDDDKVEIKISHYKKRYQKNREVPRIQPREVPTVQPRDVPTGQPFDVPTVQPRFCSETILAKSQIPLFPPRFLRNRNVQSDFVTGCFYSRNKTSVR